MPAPTIFYQSSLPRAGSTLLQNILAQNPAFHVTPTSGLLDLVYSARVAYTNNDEFKAQDSATMKKAFLGFCRGGMESYFQAITDKPYVMDKSRGWGVYFNLLQMIFDEDPKIICMVRDLRSILSSIEKLARSNPDKYKPYENATTAATGGVNTGKRVIYNLQSQPLGTALDRLVEVYQRGWSKKMLILRFEDLTTQPAASLQKVYEYLEITPFEHNFDQVPQATREDDALHGFVGLHDIRPKVAPVAPDYLEILGQDGVRYVQQNYNWYFQLFGYQSLSL